jgi:hypothetical protein
MELSNHTGNFESVFPFAPPDFSYNIGIRLPFFPFAPTDFSCILNAIIYKVEVSNK